MTEVGHAITGATICVFNLPGYASQKHKAIHMTAFMLIATIPDWPLKNWGHDKYYISHSLYVTLFLILVLFLLLALAKDIRIKIGNWPTMIGGALAWLSHLLLDSFYNHGKGIAIFWPLSKARLALPIPWFEVAIGPLSHIFRVFLIEFICYFPLLLMAIWVRRKINMTPT